MTVETFFKLVIFASVFAALYAAHQVGDHWVQTHDQACRKGERSSEGRAACLNHVLTLTAAKVFALLLLEFVIGLNLPRPLLGFALLLDAVSHFWADRRYTLAALADRIGKGDFYRLGAGLGSGAYALDQSWHVGWLFITALIIAAGA
jgi:hypothetical protein